MKQLILTIIALCAGFVGASAQDVASRILDYYEQVPQEKIYVHTDKPAYLAGDTIWYRAYLLDAATNRAAERSKFIYVELYDNQADTLITRNKIKLLPAYYMDSDTTRTDTTKVFANAIPIPRNQSTGTLTMVAYTEWMQNFSADQFYYKPVQVAAKEFIDIYAPNPTEAQVPEPVAEEQRETLWTDDITLSLMPEGGYLIAGCDQVLAFKAVDASGRGVDVDVRLIDAEGNVLREARSQHLGMGKIYVNVPADKELWLEAVAQGGATTTAHLPEPLARGASLSVAQHSGNLYVTPIASPGFDMAPLTLVIYGAGNLVTFDSLRAGTPLVIDSTKIHPGVVNIALIHNDTHSIVAERLVFVR